MDWSVRGGKHWKLSFTFLIFLLVRNSATSFSRERKLLSFQMQLQHSEKIAMHATLKIMSEILFPSFEIITIEGPGA